MLLVAHVAAPFSVNGLNSIYDWVSPARYVLCNETVARIFFFLWSYWGILRFVTLLQSVCCFSSIQILAIKQTEKDLYDWHDDSMIFSAHGIKFQILLVVLDLYLIWDDSNPFKAMMTLRRWCCRLCVRGARDETRVIIVILCDWTYLKIALVNLSLRFVGWTPVQWEMWTDLLQLFLRPQRWYVDPYIVCKYIYTIYRL